MLTTISECSANCELSVTQIRWQLTKNEVQPIDTVKWVLRGYIGRPYKVEDVNKALSGYNPKIKRIAIVEPQRINYTQSEIIQVLRNYPKYSLWNKHIKDWNSSDFTEFNNLKNR